MHGHGTMSNMCVDGFELRYLVDSKVIEERIRSSYVWESVFLKMFMNFQLISISVISMSSTDT